jgi:hypothetical protein
MFGKSTTRSNKDPAADFFRDLDAAIDRARDARVDSSLIEQVLEQRLHAQRHFIAANLRF